MRRVWECKIGGDNLAPLPMGADAPLRQAVEKAYRELTGVDSQFNFSGWGGKLDPGEESIVDHKPWRILPKFRDIRIAMGGDGNTMIVALDEGGGAWWWNGELKAWRPMDKVLEGP